MKFQSTLPQRERLRYADDIVAFGRFQSTLPQRERRSIPVRFLRTLNFNPRSHKGNDELQSIIVCPAFYFNPRSHKGSDKTRQFRDSYCCYFNPRSHKGSDHGNRQQCFERRVFQSTLPQRERPRWDIFLIFITYFNPRSHKGSDSNIAQNIEFILWNIDK